MKDYNRYLKTFSRDLRKNMTDAERHLWQYLRKKQIYGVQFYRQKPLLNYIVDFYCPAAMLIVECDGGQHYTPEGLAYDRQRDLALTALGLKVLRFSNRQVLENTTQVCECIAQHIVHYLKSNQSYLL